MYPTDNLDNDVLKALKEINDGLGCSLKEIKVYFKNLYGSKVLSINCIRDGIERAMLNKRIARFAGPKCDDYYFILGDNKVSSLKSISKFTNGLMIEENHKRKSILPKKSKSKIQRLL